MVQVKADLNMDKTKATSCATAAKRAAHDGDDGDRDAPGGGAGAGGTAGTGGNIPTYSEGAAGGGAHSNYKRKSSRARSGSTRRSPTTSRRARSTASTSPSSSTSPSPPADCAALQNAVATAAGIDTDARRHDPATQFAFAKPPAAPTPARCRPA